MGPALAASTASVLLAQLAIRLLQSWVSKPRAFGLYLWTGRWVLFCVLFFFIFGSTFAENCGYQRLHGDSPEDRNDLKEYLFFIWCFLLYKIHGLPMHLCGTFHII